MPAELPQRARAKDRGDTIVVGIDTARSRRAPGQRASGSERPGVYAVPRAEMRTLRACRDRDPEFVLLRPQVDEVIYADEHQRAAH